MKETQLFKLPFIYGDHQSQLQYIKSLTQKSRGSSVIFCNAHLISECATHPAFYESMKSASAVIFDGVPLVWTARMCGMKDPNRYSGADFMTDFFRATPNEKHFFLGSTQQVLDKIKLRFPHLNAEYFSPPFKGHFDQNELQDHRQRVLESRARFVWVGLGAPKQENYVLTQAPQTKGVVWLAVGAAFDFLSGQKARAPQFWQKYGLEWAWRLVQEPKRLGPRYLKTNPLFVLAAAKEVLRNLPRKAL
ncbi:MAG: WecB/TagA/CpsF family glycosyltransferase [Oligoflexia bacterium]|nr:WecB/TagA/CpsF family glycosyltransferase [Oligoflexia bacterium]